MAKLLQINSSVFSEQGVSSQLADSFVSEWSRLNPGAEVVRRDLAADPIPHMDGARLKALMTPEADRSAEQARTVELSNRLITELQEADVLVLGAPMYNFSVPSQLKSWFDRVARAGTTFRYTENGPEGLLTGKKAYIFTSRGGVHKDQPSDNVVPFVRQFLAFLGIDDVEIIYAEGLNMGDAFRESGIAEAKQQIQALIAA